MSETIAFLGRFDEVFPFETETLNNLFRLEDCFKQFKKNIIQIEGSNITFQTKNYNFEQISQNEETIKSANIIVLLLSYTDSNPFDFQDKNWVNNLKDCISDKQYLFLIGNTSENFNTSSISEQIFNFMKLLKIKKFFEKRSDKFIMEGEKIGSLTILPDFFKYFVNQIKLIANIPLNITENDKIIYSEGNFKYHLYPYTKTAIISQYLENTKESKIKIPSYVNFDENDYCITEIGINSFMKAKIESLEFNPDSNIKKICMLAFQLSTINTLSIPNSLEVLDEDWCKFVEHLNNIKINKDHPYFHYENGILYDKNCCEIIFAVRNLSGQIKIPENYDIKKIRSAAFYSCNQINSFAIMSSHFELIEPFAFFRCIGLKIIYIKRADKVTLGKYCFAMSKSLINITINCNELIIDNYCFQKCESILSLSLPIEKISIGSLSFLGCTKLNTFLIPQATSVEIKDHVFSSLNGLKSIILKTDHYSISNKSFDNCYSVKSIYFNTIDDINSNLFSKFINLKVIKLRSISTLTIKKLTFIDIEDIEEIQLRSKNLILEEECFKNLRKLSIIIITCENKISFSSNAFEKCESLKIFKFTKQNNFKESKKIELAENCFVNSKNLEEVELIANKIKLHNNCFKGLEKLHTIILQSKSIFADDNCFSNCSSLKTFKIIESQDIGDTYKIDLSDNCFLKTENLEIIELTASNIKLGRCCFYGSTKLQKVFIHCINAEIGDSSFSCLGMLESFTITEYKSTDNTKKVILSEKAFLNSKNLKEFVIKAKNISIGYRCFYNASNLIKISLQCDKVSISDNSFNYCSSLKTFEILESRDVSIGKKQFTGCNNLDQINIVISKNNLNCLLLENDSFSGADNLRIVKLVGGNIHLSNILLNKSSIESLIIESANDVQIDSKSFNNCSKLLSVIIDSISLKIDENCFNYNSNLEKIVFNCYNIHIQNNCFNHNTKCNYLAFNNANFVYIDSNAFCCMTSLTRLEFKSFSYFIIGQNCFKSLSKVETIKFYSNKVIMGSESFKECSALESVNSISLKINSFSTMKSAQPNTSPISYKIEEIFIGDKAFEKCYKLKELKINAQKEILIGKNCFLKNYNLEIIEIDPNCPYSYIDEKSFCDCKGFKSIPTKLFEKPKNKEKKPIINPIYLTFNNDKMFDSFYFLGIDSYTQNPSFISMFPSHPVSFQNCITDILKFCYPHGKVSVPLELTEDHPNQSYIITGFIFNFANEYAEAGYLGVAIHFGIPKSANSLVGVEYDRSYAFCLCLITSNPNIASHFSFLHSLVDPIIGKTTLQPDDYSIPDNLKNNTENCLSCLYIKPDNEYIALSPSVYSMSSFVPKLMNYYTRSPTLRTSQYKYLLYPTLQTLLTFISPSQLVDLVLAMLCEFKIAFVSNDLNKVSFCVLALINLLEDLDIFLFKFPILPSSMDHLISMPFPSIFGYDKESCHFDLIVDLEKGQIVYNNNDNNIDLSIISQFPYRDKLISKVENLLNNSLNAMIIPNKNNLNAYTQFIQNADESIYPQCFQYFAQTRYILTENLIIKLVRLLTYPFLSYLKNFVNKSIIIDESDPNMPIAKFDKKEFLNRISDIYMKFVSTLAQTETFNQLGMKLEVEKVDKIIFKQKKKYISERIENSVKHKRSNSLPIKNKLPKLIE